MTQPNNQIPLPKQTNYPNNLPKSHTQNYLTPNPTKLDSKWLWVKSLLPWRALKKPSPQKKNGGMVAFIHQFMLVMTHRVWLQAAKLANFYYLISQL